MTDFGLSIFDSLGTYSAAALDFDFATRHYWASTVTRALDLAEICPNEHVLDALCATGAATLDAATRVRPHGRVLAADFSPERLALATERASHAAVTNIDWQLEEIGRLDIPSRQFDVALCVLGLCNAVDMVGLARMLWRALRPGGRLVIATFGEDIFLPLYRIYMAAVRREQPDLIPPQPWLRTATARQLNGVLHSAGVHDVTLIEERDTVPLNDSADWRRVARAIGLGRTEALLGPEIAARIDDLSLHYISDNQVGWLDGAYLYAVARKRR